jgi:hypothetical protein
MFAFFFVAAVIAAQGFQILAGPEAVPFWKKHRALFFTGLGVCLMGAVYGSFLFWGRFDPLVFQRTLEHFSSLGMTFNDWFARSWLYQAVCGDSLRFFLKSEPWFGLFFIAKYAGLVLLLLLAIRPSRLWRSLFILAFAFEMIASWNFYAFQKDDVRAVLGDYPEIKFVKSLSASDRIAIRNDAAVNIMNFYEERRAFDWAGNLPLFWNAQTIEGSALNLSPKLFSDFWLIEKENQYTPTELRVPHSVIYDLMGMNYLFSDLPLRDDIYVELSRMERYRVYKNPKALPRFYLANGIKAVSFETAQALILSKSWDPLLQTLVESDVPNEGLGGAESAKGTIAVRSFYPARNSFELATASRRPELLATTQAFHKNWAVLVDGKPGRSQKINLYFLGVFLEPGNHAIRFQYRPQAFLIGSWVTLAALFFLIFVLIRERFFRTRKEGSL